MDTKQRTQLVRQCRFEMKQRADPWDRFDPEYGDGHGRPPERDRGNATRYRNLRASLRRPGVRRDLQRTENRLNNINSRREAAGLDARRASEEIDVSVGGMAFRRRKPYGNASVQYSARDWRQRAISGPGRAYRARTGRSY